MYQEIDFTNLPRDTRDTEITVRTPVNIAVIKYWGKRDQQLNLPLHSSISVTLATSSMYSQTTARHADQTTFCINGMVSEPTSRFKRMINKISEEKEQDVNVSIDTFNTFPTAAGLASSASGFAALATCLKLLYKSQYDVSLLARLGSGSACRSTRGGFVIWNKGDKVDGSDSISVQIAPPSHWPEFRVLVCVVCKDQKPVASTAGMQRTVETSALMKYRVQNIQDKIDKMMSAIESKNFPLFGEITMRDSNEMHAVCLDTYPPISYLNDVSHQIINFVHQYNDDKDVISAAYTFDAGPNAVIFCEEKNVFELKGLLNDKFQKHQKVTDIIECKIGHGPTILTQGNS